MRGRMMSHYIAAKTCKPAIARAPAAIERLRSIELRDREFSARHTDAAESARRRTRNWPAGSDYRAHRDRVA